MGARVSVLALAAAWLAACGAYRSSDASSGGAPIDDAGTDGAALPDGGDLGSDAAGDAAAPPPSCDLSKPFGTPVPLSVNTSAWDNGARLSADELTIWFQRRSAESTLDGRQYVATRQDRASAFGPAALVGELHAASSAEGGLTVASSGLLALFASNRTGTTGGDFDIWLTTRSSPTATWGVPVRVTNITTSSSEDDPFLRADGRALYFDSRTSGGGDLFRASVDTAGNVSAKVGITSLNTSAREEGPVVTLDELTLYFSRQNNNGIFQIFRATRASANAPWSDIGPVTELNTNDETAVDWISADGCHIAFSSTRPGAGLCDVWYAEKPDL